MVLKWSSIHVVVFSSSALFVFSGCGRDGPPQTQRDFVKGAGFLTSSEGTAINDYASAFRALERAGLSKRLAEVKRKALDELELNPADSRATEAAADSVVRGAMKIQGGLPAIGSLDNSVVIQSRAYDLAAFASVTSACVLVARSAVRGGDGERAKSVLKAVFAMGIHFSENAAPLCEALGVHARERAARMLHDIAVGDGNTALATQCQTILKDIREEFRAMKERH